MELSAISNKAYTPQSNVNTGTGGNIAMSVASALPDVGSILQSDAPIDDKLQYSKERIGLAVADVYTFGLASVAYGAVNKYLPSVAKTLRKIDKTIDPVIQVVDKFFGSKNRWKTEGNRMTKLLESGVKIPESLQGATKLTRGRNIVELLDFSVSPNFVGKKDDGTWVNNRFALSRNENDLKPEDIWGYSAFFEKFGDDWLKTFSEDQRRDIAQKALDTGSVREHHGTIDIKWTPELEKEIGTIT